jgi:hypothetical protein
MDARTTSNRELARQIGVSETAVRRAEKMGRIKGEADGWWDRARVKAEWASNTDQAAAAACHLGVRQQLDRVCDSPGAEGRAGQAQLQATHRSADQGERCAPGAG